MISLTRILLERATCLGAILLVGGLLQTAAAQPFEVKEAEVEKGELEIELNGAVQSGFPPEGDDDDEEENIRHAHEASIGYGITEFLKIEAGLVGEAEVGEQLVVTNAEVSATFEFLEQEADGFGLAFYAGIEPRIDDDATNEVEFGPIFAFTHCNIETTVNTFLERSFGANREEGTGFAYAWQSRIEVDEGVGVGFEAYGEVEDIGEPGLVSEQEHRLGPVAYFETEFGEDQELSIDVGLLFGLTRDTPDLAIKWNIALEL